MKTELLYLLNCILIEDEMESGHRWKIPKLKSEADILKHAKRRQRKWISDPVKRGSFVDKAATS